MQHAHVTVLKAIEGGLSNRPPYRICAQLCETMVSDMATIRMFASTYEGAIRTREHGALQYAATSSLLLRYYGYSLNARKH